MTAELRKKIAPEIRFWRHVQKTPTCWLWTGCTTRKGYGNFRAESMVVAHRYAYEVAVGPIAPGMVLDHLCFVRHCVNPDHLRPITPKQNQEHRLGAPRNSRTGVRGVYVDKQSGRYRARFKNNGRFIEVGLFDDLAEAKKAVEAARSATHTHDDGLRTFEEAHN